MHQLTIPDTRSLKPTTPTQLVEDAYRWVCDNPEAWAWLVGAAERDALDGVRVAVKSYVETLRRRPLPWATKVIKLPNAYSAAFTRFLWEWHEELRPLIPKAASKLDGCAIPRRPY